MLFNVLGWSFPLKGNFPFTAANGRKRGNGTETSEKPSARREFDRGRVGRRGSGCRRGESTFLRTARSAARESLFYTRLPASLSVCGENAGNWTEFLVIGRKSFSLSVERVSCYRSKEFLVIGRLRCRGFSLIFSLNEITKK